MQRVWKDICKWISQRVSEWALLAHNGTLSSSAYLSLSECLLRRRRRRLHKTLGGGKRTGLRLLDDFSLRSISGCIVRRRFLALSLNTLYSYLSSTDNWTSQVINEPLALKGLMRARSASAPLFKQPSRATPTFRLVAIMVIEFVQIAVNSRLPPAGDERKSDARTHCMRAYLESHLYSEEKWSSSFCCASRDILNSTLIISCCEFAKSWIWALSILFII